MSVTGSPVLSYEYYKKAIAFVAQKINNPTFFIFSDDMQWAVKHLRFGFPVVCVDINNEASASEDLRLMSTCDHHVIANSSFSWWGAWLNPSPEKIVIAPKYWMMKESSYYPDLYPPEWVLIDNL